jgi:hypothetical protein
MSIFMNLTFAMTVNKKKRQNTDIQKKKIVSNLDICPEILPKEKEI